MCRTPYLCRRLDYSTLTELVFGLSWMNVLRDLGSYKDCFSRVEVYK